MIYYLDVWLQFHGEMNVQIIIVDDKSDQRLVDFEKFPGKNDKYVEFVFTTKGRGAGYARNVGLQHAKGKWVVFADTDEYYLDNLNQMMDRYQDSDADMIIFRQIREDYAGIRQNNATYYRWFDDAAETGDYDFLLFNYSPVYGRFIKRKFLEENDIRFQEVRYSNDVMFSLKCGKLASNVQFVDIPIYCVVKTADSLMRNSS